jgi:hypothetical protein
MPASKRISVAVVSLGLCGVASGQSVFIESIAYLGDAAPGVPGVRFVEFGAPVGSAFGEVAFVARIDGPGVTPDNNVGVWGGAYRALQLVARKGDQAPGTGPGEVFAGSVIFTGMPPFGQPTIGERGEVAFRASLEGATVTPDNDEGLWWGLPGRMELAAREQMPVANAPGVSLRRIWFQPATAGPPTMPGWSLLGGAVTPADDSAIVMTVLPDVEIIARAGGPVPGHNAEFDGFGAGQARSVSLGRLTAFTARLRGPAVTTDDDEAVVMYRAGQLEVIARENEPIPTAARGQVHAGEFHPPYTAASPDMCVFLGKIRGPNITQDNDEAVWLYDAATGLRRVANEGQAAPGAPSGVELAGSFSYPIVSQGGRVAFTSWLRGPGVTQDNNVALFVQEPGRGTRLLARKGDQAPGLAPGVVYASHIGQVHSRVGPRSSLFVFHAGLDGPGVTPANNTAVFGAWDGPGSCSDPVVLLRAGDDVEIVPGLRRTIQAVSLLGEESGGADGRTSPIIDNERIVAHLMFTNGESGIVVAGLCYADCDSSGALDFFDFLCFQNEFLNGTAYADCDCNGVLDFFDFLCFQNEFLAGCP